jgi:enoyl-CoA hydratase/carnithine racemase
MVQMVGDKVKEWSVDDGKKAPRVAMMSGTGGKAFCAGGNLKGLYDSLKGKENKDKNLKDTFLATSYAVDYSL